MYMEIPERGGYVMISDYGNTINGLKVEVRVHWNHEANDFVAYIKILAGPNTLPAHIKRNTKVPLRDLENTLKRLYHKLQKYYSQIHQEKELQELKDRERNLANRIKDINNTLKAFERQKGDYVKEQLKTRAQLMALQYGEPGVWQEEQSPQTSPRRCFHCDNPIDDSF